MHVHVRYGVHVESLVWHVKEHKSLVLTEIFQNFQSTIKFSQQVVPLTTVTVNIQKTFCSQKYSTYLWQKFWTAKDNRKLLPSSFIFLFLLRLASLPYYLLSILIPCTMYSKRPVNCFWWIWCQARLHVLISRFYWHFCCDCSPPWSRKHKLHF